MNIQKIRERFYAEAVSRTSWLRKWLNDEEIDPYHWSWLIPKWAKETNADIEEDDYEYFQIDNLTKDQQNDFKMWLKNQRDTGQLSKYGPDFDQANFYFLGGDIVKTDEWMIHFTPDSADALKIAADGFKKGVDTRTLHISDLADKFEQEYGDFAFAFRTDRRIWEVSSRNGKYGRNAVMFQTESGVESYHLGDEEHQVIFHKAMTRNRVPILYKKGYDEWYVPNKKGDRELAKGDLKYLVNWVKKNFAQYKKSISYGSK
jgi:hypothetical protein